MRSVCGLDVHKDSVYLCILSEDGELIEKVFEVLAQPTNPVECVQSLTQNSC